MTPTTRTHFEIWGPPVLFMLTVIGLAVAAEHRMTVIEECQKTTTTMLDEIASTVHVLQQNQIRVVAVLDIIEKRHQLEDQKK